MIEPEPHIALRNRLDHNGQRLWDMNRPMAELLIDAANEIDRLSRLLWSADKAAVRLSGMCRDLRDDLNAANKRADLWENLATNLKASRSHHTEL